MINLEQDIIEAQIKVTDTLAEYEKVSEDIIKSNYTSQLHNLLQTISSFDATKVKECEHSFKDEVAVKYIQAIADKIKSSEQPKPAPSPAPKTERISKSVDKVESKRESRLAEKNEDKKSGFIDYVRSKFTSKDKKVTQMILPDEEPKCYYDPVTKSYIFEGEEPQAPKVIQKPPSVAAKKNKQEVKKPVNDDSQLGQLTAPPAFRRKSTPGGNAKSKIKMKQQAEVVKEIEPLTFARLMDIVNESYKAIVERVKNGVYDRHISLPNQNAESISQILSFTQRTLQASEQISTHEHKLIQKWGKMLASQSRELKIMEKVLKQIGDSGQTYTSVLAKLNTPHQNRDRIKREQIVVIKQVIKQVQKQILKQVEKVVIKEVFNQKETANQSSQTELIQHPINVTKQVQSAIVKALEQANRKYYTTSLNLSDISEQKQRLQNLLKRYQRKIQDLESNKSELQQIITNLTEQTQNYKQKQKENGSVHLQLSKKVKILSNQVKQYQEKQKRYIAERSQEISQITNQFSIKSQKNIAEISELQQKNYILQQEKSQLVEQLKQEMKNKDSSADKVANQIVKQKNKIKSQLRFYEQKEKIYISSLQNLQQQSILIQDYESSLCQENLLLNIILEKRLQLNKNPENDDPLVYAKPSQEPTSHSIILQLSQIVNSITETHLDRLEAYNRHYAKLHKKYLETKQVLNKIKSSSANQNMSLNRNVTRLKGLLETYKTAKDEAEERCSQLELQCDKLKKKLLHYKEQDQFNKSYLSRLKSSKIHSQNESVLSLQEDNGQLATQIQQLQKQVAQKNEVLKKNQTDLQDLLINYEKNQTRLLQTEKRYKQSQKELRKIQLQLEEQTTNNKLLELKLQNTKGKYDQNQNKQEIRIKNAESAFEKKIKLIKHDLDESNLRQNNLRIQIEELKRENKERLASLQQSHFSIVRELNGKVQQKQVQVSQAIVLLDETNQKLEVQQEEKALLISKNNKLIQVQRQLNTKISEIIDQHLKEIAIHNESKYNLNNIIAELAFNYNSLKQEQLKFQSSYNQNIKQLEQALGSSFEESKNLQDQISQYSQLLIQSSERFQHIKRQQQKNKQSESQNRQQNQKKIKELKEVIAYLQEQLEERTNENKILEQLIQKMSQDMSRMAANEQQIAKDKIDLQEKLIQKDRLIETLSNQINKKSEQLMVKTEQLQEKDSALLQQQEQSVMRKEQLDEVKNQLLKLRAELKDKEKQIIQLTADLQQLAEKIANNESNKEKSKILQENSSQINQLKQAIALEDQQIFNLAQNSYKINFELEQKNAQIEKLNVVLAKQAEYLKQIEQLNEAILQINASLEESEAQSSSLQKHNSRQQNLIKELQIKIFQKQAQLSSVLEKHPTTQKENKQIEQLNEAILQMNASLEKSETQVSSLQMHNKNQQKIIKELQTQINQKQSQLSAALEKLASTQKENIKQIEQLNEAILQMNASLEKSETQVSLLQKHNKNQQSLIIEIQSKISQKQAQLSSVLEKLAAAQKENTKQIEDNDQIEGEMEYLLKQIAAKETQLQNIAHEIKLKNIQYNELGEKYNHLQAKFEKYKEQFKVALSQVETLALQNRRLLEQKFNQQIQLNEKQKEKQQLIQLIQNLERQIGQTKKSPQIQSQNTQNHTKEQQQLIQQLTNEVSIKDRALIDKQILIQQKQSAKRQLQIQIKQNEEIIKETKRSLAQKHKAITEIQISEQQKQRIIVELEKSLKESEDKYTQLENSLAEMAQVIESQDGIIQTLKNEASTYDKNNATELLAYELKEKINEISDLKKKYQQLKLTYTQKERQYQNKIQTLQRENAGINSLKNANKRLEESLKALEDENKLLTNQKVQLMKSNDYLVGINQKLIADKSPQNSKDNHKIHAHSNDRPAEKSQTQAQGIKQAKQTKQIKKESTGLFGALSSLFLTQTQTERLRK